MSINHISNKGYVSKIYKEKPKKWRMNKKDRQPTEEWAEDLNRHLKIVHFHFSVVGSRILEFLFLSDLPQSLFIFRRNK